MSSSNVSDKLETLKAELSAQGVRVDNVGDLTLLLLAEMRSSNVKLAYALGGGGTFMGVVIGMLIPLLFLH